MVGEIAGRQRGLVARRQLLDAGVGRGTIDDRVRRGLLLPVHRGVYAVGHRVPPAFAREQAALLACGQNARLARRSSALAAGIIGQWEGPPEIVVASRTRRPGITVISRQLQPWELTEHQGLPTTHPVSTLLALAGVLGADDLEQAVAQSIRLRLTSERQIAAVLAKASRRPGAGALRALIDGDAPRFTRSQAERRLLALIAKAGLPRPQVNQRLAGYEVDLLWPEQRLVVEIDGFRFHGDRLAFERDRRRDADLTAHGYRVLRITWRQIVDEPELVVARLAAVLLGAFTV